MQTEQQLAQGEHTDHLIREAEQLRAMLQSELGRRLRSHFSRQPDKQNVTQEHLDALSGELKRLTAFYRRRCREGSASPWQEARELLHCQVPMRALSPLYWEVLKTVLGSGSWTPRRFSDDDVVHILAWTYRCLRSPETEQIHA